MRGARRERSTAVTAAALGTIAAVVLVFLACSASPPPAPPPPPPTPLPTPVVVPLQEPGDLAREVLADAGFTEIEEDPASGTIVARLRESVATEEEEGDAVAELRRIAHFDEDFGSERIADYSIRVEIRMKQADSSELALAAKAEIWASPRARSAEVPSLAERQLVSRGVLERELIERIHARWSE